MQYAHDFRYKSAARGVFTAFPASRVLASSTFFDDLQWWGLAYVRYYEVFGDKTALTNATAIFNFVQANSWDTVCGGMIVVCGGMNVVCGGMSVVCGGMIVVCGGMSVVCGGMSVVCGGMSLFVILCFFFSHFQFIS
jgi:hypothetical protein